MKTFSTACLLGFIVAVNVCFPVYPVSPSEKQELSLAEHRPQDTALKNSSGDQVASTLLLSKKTTLFNLNAKDDNTEVWNKLLDNFNIDFENHHTPVKKHIARYEKNLHLVNKTLQRAQPYMPYLAHEIANRNLPGELALLPFIESAYDLEASNRSAVGLWQLVPATATRFGAKQNHWYDGRYDLQSSTQAALNYLEYLNELFKGDWLLVLAAYNSGEGTVQRAIRKNSAAGKATDFWSLSLPPITREYVPKLMALSKVIADQQGDDHFFATKKTYLAPVYVNSPIDLDLAAKLADISVNELYDLNPGIKKRIRTTPTSHTLLMPSDKIEVFLSRLHEVPFDKRVHSRWSHLSVGGKTLTATRSAQKLMTMSSKSLTRTYQVRAGDNLSKIARQFNTTPQQLLALNQLKSSEVLQVGQLLKVKA